MGARLQTDEFHTYKKVGPEFDLGHGSVKHSAKEYVRGNDYSNTAESFFSLLKRGINGSFHHVSKKHLPRYLDEFSARWNGRNLTDEERTEVTIRGAGGKRLTYRKPKM